jgi:2,3-bisphosphoglycerate-independent phosphoglycerate mutase
MSANYITKVTIDQMMQTDNVFILVNFANVDYFAHTKDIKKTSSAVKFIDQCLGLLVDASERTGTSLVITSDHGNAESMASVNEIIKADQHSKNPVPLIVVSGSTKRNFGNTIVGSGGLDNLLATQNTICDIAPTILDLFGIKKPIEFTGNSLLNILD